MSLENRRARDYNPWPEHISMSMPCPGAPTCRIPAKPRIRVILDRHSEGNQSASPADARTESRPAMGLSREAAPLDVLCYRVHVAGWSIGETCTAGEWVVVGFNGKESARCSPKGTFSSDTLASRRTFGQNVLAGCSRPAAPRSRTPPIPSCLTAGHSRFCNQGSRRHSPKPEERCMCDPDPGFQEYQCLMREACEALDRAKAANDRSDTAEYHRLLEASIRCGEGAIAAISRKRRQGSSLPASSSVASAK